MLLQVENRQERIWIRLIPIDLHRRSQQRLPQDQVGEGRHIEDLGIVVEQLAEEVLQAVEINGGLRVEPFEVDIDHLNILLWIRGSSGAVRYMAQTHVVGFVAGAFGTTHRHIAEILLSLAHG